VIGAYDSGSQFTGFTGVMRAGKMLSKDDLVQVFRGGYDFNHDLRFDNSKKSLGTLAVLLDR